MQMLFNTKRTLSGPPSSLLLHRKSTLFMVHAIMWYNIGDIAMGIIHMIFGYGFLTYETGLRKPPSYARPQAGGGSTDRWTDRETCRAYALTRTMRTS